jgi:glycosyltransferase involved in cell wall biosynthesis
MMRSGRVCIVVQNYYDFDPRVRRETEALAKEGYQVDIVALRMEGRSEIPVPAAKISLFTLPMKKQRAGICRYLWEFLVFFIYSFAFLTWRSFTRRYKVVQVCNIPDFLIFSAIVPKLFGAKVVFDMHEIMPELFMSIYELPEKHLLVRLLVFLEKLSVSFADEVIVVTDPIKELLDSRCGSAEKTIVVMNAADEDLFRTTLAKAKKERADSFRFYFHGTVSYRFGLDLALEAFAAALSEMPQAEFWIIGNGPERRNLEAQSRGLGIHDRVSFLGAIPHNEIPSWLDRCDVAVVPIRKDRFLDLAFSSKVPESILKHKPVIMARVNTMEHYFSERALAYFDPYSVEDLACQMQRLYKDKDYRSQLVRRAAEEYSKINWREMKGRYLSLFDRSLLVS